MNFSLESYSDILSVQVCGQYKQFDVLKLLELKKTYFSNKKNFLKKENLNSKNIYCIKCINWNK